MERRSTAIWKGAVKTGSGTLSTQSGVLDKTPYSWHSRFEQGAGTNPEELLAAAHAGCFTMKLSALLTEAGFTPDVLQTVGAIEMKEGVITRSHLAVQAKVPNLRYELFQKLADNAKQNCPMSKALGAIQITMEIALEEHVTT